MQNKLGFDYTTPYQVAAVSPDGLWGIYASDDENARDQARLIEFLNSKILEISFPDK